MAKKLNFPRINLVVLSGRLTRDVDLRYTTNGKAVATLSLAFDRAIKTPSGEWQNETSYVYVIVWDKRAEQCGATLKKGSPILVEGNLRVRTYVDSNGQNRRVTEIIARKINFLERDFEQQIEEDINTIPTDDLVETTKDDEVPF